MCICKWQVSGRCKVIKNRNSWISLSLWVLNSDKYSNFNERPIMIRKAINIFKKCLRLFCWRYFNERFLPIIVRATMYFRVLKHVNSLLFVDLSSLPLQDQNLSRCHFWKTYRVTWYDVIGHHSKKNFFSKKLIFFTIVINVRNRQRSVCWRIKHLE